MDAILEELKEREAYMYDTYAPYFVCSYAMHVFNLINYKKEIYWESRQLPNMRMHILFVAPPGFMKTFFQRQMGADRYGIFAGCTITMGQEASMSEAGLIGTIRPYEDTVIESEGAAQTYKEAVLMIDEFAAITNAFKTNYNNQMDSQMLNALDHGKVIKRLGGGRIEYQTNFTLWTGVQPAKYDLTSGMGRRFLFLLFMPTMKENNALLRAIHAAENIRPNIPKMQTLWALINRWIEEFDIIESIQFADSMIDFYEDIGIYTFEKMYFDRLALGYALAKYGPKQHMVIDARDEGIRKFIIQQKEWRDIWSN
jgi:hypothetical protein